MSQKNLDVNTQHSRIRKSYNRSGSPTTQPRKILGLVVLMVLSDSGYFVRITYILFEN